MTCTHCGKEIDNDLAFCPYCGSRTENGAAAAEKPAKKNPRRFALPVAAAALLAVVGVGLANRKPSIDLQRYVTITAHGMIPLARWTLRLIPINWKQTMASGSRAASKRRWMPTRRTPMA